MPTAKSIHVYFWSMEPMESKMCTASKKRYVKPVSESEQTTLFLSTLIQPTFQIFKKIHIKLEKKINGKEKDRALNKINTVFRET